MRIETNLPVQIDPKKRWVDVISIVLVMICLFIASLRLLATRWTENLTITQTIAFFGIILGLALGYSIFSHRVSIFFAISYGIITIPWQLGLTMEKDVINWVEKLINMRGRLEVTLSELLQREAIEDNLLFILLMSVTFWILSVHAGYTLTRYANPWKIIIPTGITIFIIHTFDSLLVSRSWYLAFYLLFAMIMLARLVYLHKRQRWFQYHSHTPTDVGFDFSRIAVIAAIILVFIAWNVPVLANSLDPVANAWSAVTRPWQTYKDKFGFAFASLRASVGVVTNMYGETILLGRGTPLGDAVILEAEIPETSLFGTRFYWRGRVYGTYNDGGWDNSYDEDISLTAESADLNVIGNDKRQNINITITSYDAISLLYVAAQPLWVNRPTTASVVNYPDGSTDLGSFTVKEYIRPGERYDSRSALSTVSVTELREAGTDYPQWVTDNYLQLPDNITPRTYELAQRLASGYETPYDIAEEITNYLRANITYTPTVPDPPIGQERIDWFLFDLQQGYCNYYASAEVILLRSLGIPSRLAVGFAQGERVIPIIPGQGPNPGGVPPEPAEGQPIAYVVRQRDAHAWPEVYFPNIGWIEFEPTGSQDALIRPLGGDFPDEESQNRDQQRDQPSSQQSEAELLRGLDSPSGTKYSGNFWTPKNVFITLMTSLSVALLGIVLWRVKRGFRFVPYVERLSIDIPIRLEQRLLRLGIRPPKILRRWVYYAQLPVLSRSYLQINHALDRLGARPEIQNTPIERVIQLTSILPIIEQPANLILKEYQTAIYSPLPADDEKAVLAGKEVRKQSYLEILRRWLAKFQEPTRRKPYE